MNTYTYRIYYTRGRWHGRRIIPAIDDFYQDTGSVSAYTEKQARFFVSKELQDKIGSPVFVADFSCYLAEEKKAECEQLCFL